MTSHGYLALIIFAFIEAACIPISSEVTFALAGFLASQGKFSLAGVILVGTAAELGGSLFSYGIGRLGGRTFLERHGKWVLVSRFVSAVAGVLAPRSLTSSTAKKSPAPRTSPMSLCRAARPCRRPRV